MLLLHLVDICFSCRRAAEDEGDLPCCYTLLWPSLTREDNVVKGFEGFPI